MRWTLQTRLSAIVGIAAFAFLLLLVVGSYTFFHVDSELSALEQQYLPKLELGPKLESDFERLNRKFEDAVQAQEPEALDDARRIRDQFIARLDESGPTYLPQNVQALRTAFSDYYRSADAVSRRLIAGETGEAIVARMEKMQSRRARAATLLGRTTAFNRAELQRAFVAVREVQRDAAALRIAIAGICMALVLLLSWGMSRGVFRVLADITSGLERFGRGDLAARIPITSADELSVVAERANQMAGNLDRIRRERDRIDWLRNGHAALSKEVRGELDPAEVARRAIACLARYLDAPAAALYQSDDRRTLRLVAEYAGAAAAGAESPSFRFGEGLVGQAALSEELMVVDEPPPDYFRVRSAFGEASPTTIVLLPLVHAGRVTGVIEFAVFGPWSELSSELLLSVRESLAIALEVARARAFLRTLLAEAQEFTRRLTAQEEQLRATNEELESQQEELRQTNEELSEQAKEMRAQRAALEERNLELTDARSSLEQKAHELESVSAYKSQFLANMSHELRTPLNSMILLSSLLAENESGNLTAKQVEFCETVHAAGRDLLGLINQVLDLAKVEAGKQDVKVEPIDLEDVAAHARGIFGPLAADKGLTLEVEVTPDAPAALVSDRQRIEQILNNLLGNAIKFTEHGRVALSIQRPPEAIAFERMGLHRDEAIAFVVSDTGKGIAPAQHERMFAPFEQGEAATDRRYGGTGLGLTIARSLTALLGGELLLESAPGRGSTFTCCLPLTFSEPHPSPPPAEVSRRGVASFAGPR
jgi:signal transduction histidine kinase